MATTGDFRLSELLDEVLAEYHQTGLHKQGFVLRDRSFALLQAEKIVSALPGNGAVFVDIGTGMGILPRLVRKLGVRSISVDWPVTGGLDAVAEIRKAGVEGHYCEVGNEPIPVADGTADCVLFCDVIEHLAHSPAPVLKEIHRVLKPGGVCVAATPNATRLTVRLKVLMGYSNWPHISDYYHEPYHGGHHHEYTIEEFVSVFQWAGFTIGELILLESNLKHVGVGSFDEISSRIRARDQDRRDHLLVRTFKPLLIRITGAFPRLRSTMLLVARKPL